VRPLAPSPAWTLVTPYCKRTRPGRGTNTKAAGFPPLSRRSPAASLSPLRARPRVDPSGLGHATTFTRRLRDPPVSKHRQHPKPLCVHSGFRALKFIQALKLNTTHIGVGYYAPAVRTTLNPCVFLCLFSFPPNRQNA
jgi:hypothetical protein